MPSLSLSKGYLPNTLQPPTPPEFLLLGMMLYGMEYPLSSTWVSCPVASPSNHLPTLSLLTGKGQSGRVGKRESLAAVQVLLSISQNTAVLCTLL